MEVREARNEEEQQAVYRLTYEVYHQQGYCNQREDGMLRHYPDLDGIPETSVFVAYEAGRLIGTCSYTEDGPVGLHVDKDFPVLVGRVRKRCWDNGLRLGASWRILTRPEARSGLTLVMGLMDATMKLFIGKDDVALFSFNPRHESFYKRMLDLDTIGKAVCEAVGNAPAILMQGSRFKMIRRWREVCRKRGFSSRV